VLTGGKRHQLGGLFYEPTVLSGCTKDMLISHEETFGPVAPLFRFRHEAEAIELANATPFGLAAYFFTENLHRSWRVAERLSRSHGPSHGAASARHMPM
jgi:succinate-semialdehyde dehydrogenase / glutarate-semialdehyde dehydrogenase